MKKLLSFLIILSIILSMGFSFKSLASSESGWYLKNIEFKDGTTSGFSGVLASKGTLHDEYTYSGGKNDITISHVRHHYNTETKQNGSLIAKTITNQKWTEPQSFLREGERLAIEAESTLVDFYTWKSPHDMSFYTNSSQTTLLDEQGRKYMSEGGSATFKSKEMKKGKPGDIINFDIGLGDGFQYKYIYEWKEPVTEPVPAPIPQGQVNTNLMGKWNINGNGYIGTINITNQTGDKFTGTVDYKGERQNNLTNGSINGDTVIFDRQWVNSTFKQVYTGTLTIEDGQMKLKGTFTSSGSIYKWEASKEVSAPIPKPTPVDPVSGNNAEAFESGARIMWQPANGLGYRLFRSTSSSELGISVTDFYITSTSYADVNIEPNTTYYYTVKPVIAEAKPFEGIDEKLGDTIATFTVKTGSEIYKPGSFKHFIMLTLESPNMSVDGINQEVDPGRGTVPLVISGRTMVPIRAVVEAMDGTVEWDGNTKKITLKARENTVEMWLGKTEIKVNGQSKKMDIAPTSKNERTYVPVRFAAENLNCKVDWINSTKEAVIVYEE